MARRTPETQAKRLREQAKKEKRRAKQERRALRKKQKAEGLVPGAQPETETEEMEIQPSAPPSTSQDA